MAPRLADVRPACAAAAAASQIAIDDAAIDAFLANLDTQRFDALKKEHGLVFPLKFPSFHDEVNFLGVLSLLNALSGYRKAFHEATGHGAFDNTRHMLLGLYLSNEDALSAKALREVTPTQLANVLGVPTHTESKHPTLPFVTVGTVGGPLHAPLELVANTCKAAGQFLEAEGKPDLGRYLLDACAEALEKERPESHLLESIVCVPGFDDATTLDGQPVYIYKKAFFLMNALRERVTGSLPPDAPPAAAQLAERWRTGFPEPLPMFVDNVIPTLLHHYGIVRTADASSEVLRSWTASDEGVRLQKDDAYRIRAAALAAGARIVERAQLPMTEVELDGYLWTVAKDPALRSLPRIAEQDTMMY
ncbi:hypothetical protein MOBT1_000364 [Malassezia obtusa]|uniref:Queuosine 5'-phosphate N-glycosylase/hydrolase n=1 Tax=Malassezia obtusa TaxID=76774 RepID=A0AAF0DWA6_9BASI|nr:hypothetical protein MOBT1_000364 [Malassezia obtusa]